MSDQANVETLPMEDLEVLVADRREALRVASGAYDEALRRREAAQVALSPVKIGDHVVATGYAYRHKTFRVVRMYTSYGGIAVGGYQLRKDGTFGETMRDLGTHWKELPKEPPALSPIRSASGLDEQRSAVPKTASITPTSL